MGKEVLKAKFNRRAIKLLERLPMHVQGRIGSKALTSGVRVLRKALKARLPDSSKTGTKDKQSKSAKTRGASWSKMKDSMKVYNLFRKGSVGARLWIPGMAWFEFGFTHKLWGGKTYSKGRGAGSDYTGVVRRTADQTKRQQEREVIKVLVQGIRKEESKAK